MNKSKRNKILNIIGTISIIWGISAIIVNILKVSTGVAPILWMSYICLLVLGIGILRKDSVLIASQLCILGIPYLIWNIDFFYHLFTGKSLYGITDYFFKINNLLDIEKIISLQHIFNIPFSLLSIYLIGLHKKDFWKISVFQITLVFVVTRLLTTSKENVNCAYRSCGNITFGLPYVIEWFIVYIFMIAVMHTIVIKIFYKK